MPATMSSATTTRGIATAIPIFPPVDRPDDLLDELALDVARAAVPELDEDEDVVVADVASAVVGATGTAAVDVIRTVTGAAVEAPLAADSVTTEVIKAMEEP